VATRIGLLAHWTTDVAAGFAMGVVIEHLLGYVSQMGGPLKELQMSFIPTREKAALTILSLYRRPAG
jgi:membrane-associated phospholipid phosphatase